MLGTDIVGVVVKTAVGSSAAITYSPKRVQQMLRDSTAVAVKRALNKQYKPFTLAQPYQVEFVVRRSYPPEFIAGIDSLVTRFSLEKAGERTYRMTTTSARQIGYVIDAIERVVLR